MLGAGKRRLKTVVCVSASPPDSAHGAAASARAVSRQSQTSLLHRSFPLALRLPSLPRRGVQSLIRSPLRSHSAFLLRRPLVTSPLPSPPACRHLFGLSSTSLPPITQQIRRRLPFPPSAFFSLVLDVPSYQQFLPYCLQSTLLASSPATHSFTAQLSLGFSAFQEQYTSLVTYSSPATTPTQQLYRVHARSLNCTLFNHLSSTWEIRPVPGRLRECDVTFDIEMSINSALHRAVVSRVFSNVAVQQLDAFVQRGQQLMSAAVHEREERQAASARQAVRAASVDRGVI